ncbi:uncharacterized protein METZ01_LOCUS461775, partial [marine metagenome]
MMTARVQMWDAPNTTWKRKKRAWFPSGVIVASMIKIDETLPQVRLAMGSC